VSEARPVNYIYRASLSKTPSKLHTMVVISLCGVLLVSMDNGGFCIAKTQS
jgi:hypothetical protein